MDVLFFQDDSYVNLSLVLCGSGFSFAIILVSLFPAFTASVPDFMRDQCCPLTEYNRISALFYEGKVPAGVLTVFLRRMLIASCVESILTPNFYAFN